MKTTAPKPRPRSGLNLVPNRSVRVPDDIYAAQRAHVASKGEDWSAWVLRVTEAARARGE